MSDESTVPDPTDAGANRRDHHGNLYQTGDWNDDLTTIEVDAYRELAESWLVHWLHRHDMISPSGDWGPIHGQPERTIRARPQVSARATLPRLP